MQVELVRALELEDNNTTGRIHVFQTYRTRINLHQRYWPGGRHAAAAADTNVSVIVDPETPTTIATIPQEILA